jgi:hypothetical protein
MFRRSTILAPLACALSAPFAQARVTRIVIDEARRLPAADAIGRCARCAAPASLNDIFAGFRSRRAASGV